MPKPTASTNTEFVPGTEYTGQERPTMLIVDDQSKSLAALSSLLKTQTFCPLWVQGCRRALEFLQKNKDLVRLIVLDQKLSPLGGAGFLLQAKKIAPEAAFLITAPLGPMLYCRGCFYELCGVNLKENLETILQAIAEKIGLTRHEPSSRQQTEARLQGFGQLLGRSRAMNQIYDLVQNLGKSKATILIKGESGTGKELLARTIHQTSSCSHGAFVPVNCGAIPAGLVESELFGHEKGAFTSAHSQHKGKFEAAGQGTLFLDEVGELAPEVQVKLLRVLQEREFYRVGGNNAIPAQCRLIAATSRDLQQDVYLGRFRADLYYRLNVIPMRMPALREHRQDIPLLLKHFFRAFSQELQRKPPVLSKEAAEAMYSYSFPGNVRELVNIVQRLCVLCPEQVIHVADLPQEVRSDPSHDVPELLQSLPQNGVTLQRMEKELILKTLDLTQGNKAQAAKKLGITRRLLYLRLDNYGISNQHSGTSGDTSRQ